jgi:hypothetical protein
MSDESTDLTTTTNRMGLAFVEEPRSPPSLLNFVAQAVSDPAVDVAKLEALLRMQREIVADEAKITFNKALRSAQAEIPPIEKNGTIRLVRDGVDKGSIPFTTWEDMDKVMRPIMDRYGFTLTFDMSMKDGGGAVITGTLLHVDGYSKSASIPLALDTGPGRNNLQAMGSTLSYGRRYTAEMLFNLVRKGVDDDGNRGGTKFIREHEAEELRALCKAAGRQEGPLLDRLFAGRVKSFDEIEVGGAYAAARSTLEGIIHQQRKKTESET